MNQQKIGKFIKDKRKTKKITQMELAERLNVSNRTVSKWENGNSFPDYSILNDLCKELDITINDLFQGEQINEENYKKEVKYKKKKTGRLVLILILFLVILYLIYKSFILFYFITYYKDDVFGNEFPYNDNIGDLLVKNNGKANTSIDKVINIYIPSDFLLITDKKESYLVKDDCYSYIKGLSNKEFSAAIMICHNEFNNLSNLDHIDIKNNLFPYLDVNSTLNKNNINNVLDLIKYYEKHYNDKFTIFTNSNKIKMYYIAKQYVKNVLPSYDNFYYLKGSISGYYKEIKGNNKIKSNYEAMILLDNKGSYYVSFINNNEEYFTKDNSLDIIRSIVLNKE